MPPIDPRPYSSPKRDAAAAEKRQLVLDTAVRLLDEGSSLVSMDAVAKAAGVTRLTVYKQFGSRRGLLEAVFDENARRGGIYRMAEAMQNPDGRAALKQAIDIMCEFWGSHPSFARLHDAAGVDPEFAEAIATRNERRRIVLNAALSRLNGTDAARRDAADMLFGLTSMAMFRILSVGRTPAEIAEVMKRSTCAILDAMA
ncbi:MAG: TetR/AcrR family transcriptional regulator [Asticcacaulis sp.]|nr:TetR/AcrR family transcriptional regulator [Asticcacaulis sp.]